jgi:multiple sugar transport system ATP-binding protein
MEPVGQVQLQGLHKYFGDVAAVRDVNLDIRDKEFVVLVGPSGCGKSTTLRMIAGLEKISAGTIRIGERVVNDLLPKDRDIAMVFQNYALYMHMSVYDNMAFGLRNRRVPEPQIRQRVEEAAEILGIKALFARRPSQLSGGQRQRVALGRAIVRNPQVFLFDEPLSNLDAQLRTQMRFEIRGLHNRLESTVIYVTHDQVEAMTLGDRVVVMRDGRISQVGPPLELYTRPKSRFVAGFIGSPMMNFVDTRLREQGGGLLAEAGALRLEVPGDRVRALQPYLARSVVLGVRPENITLGQGAPGSTFQAVVNVIEPLGPDLLLEVRAGATPLVVSRVDPASAVRPAETATFRVRADQLHFFDPDTGLAIEPQA